MCGIFGWSGKDPKKFNKTKLDILGIFNEARGTHSCGITKDGDISIGIDKNKVYKDFLTNVNYDAPKMFPVVIGHTRASTYGAHTVENAHPFGFGEINEHYEFVGVHNGTLTNHHEVARLNNISITETKKTENASITRTKIDSEILLEAIFHNQNYDALSQYNGAAALVFSNLNEPNTIYCFHGESKKDSNGIIEEEERPLFYYQESKNSLYISSMRSSLFAIGGTINTVDSFDCNVVYKITNGELENATKTVIDRSKNYQNYVHSAVGYTRHIVNTRDAWDDLENDYYGGAFEGPNHLDTKTAKEVIEDERKKVKAEADTKREEKSGKSRQTLLGLDGELDLGKEVYFQLDGNYKSSIYFNKMRYWRNGHLITGCYTWITDYGFYPLGERIKDAEENFFYLVNKPFLNNNFINDLKGLSAKQLNKVIVPFVSTKEKEIIRPIMYYFYDGVRIKTRMDYLACLDMAKFDAPFDHLALSICAAHPVLNINPSNKYVSQRSYLNDKLVTDVHCPLGSENIYTFIDGRCVRIDKKVKTPDSLKTIAKLLIDNEKEVVAKEKEILLPVVIENNNDLLDKDMDEAFKDALSKFPLFIKRLETYKGEKKAERAVDILNSFLVETTRLITFDIIE